jgi:uncharacterized protein (TIGR02246 family)
MPWDALMPTTTPPAPTVADPGDHADDIAAIAALVADVAAGVTARDPDRCVARFAADTRSVTNTRLVGREAVRQAHVDAFASAGTPPRARFELLDVLFVRPDVAVATTGAYPVGLDDPIDRDAPPTVITWTLVRDDDGWWVASRQFTAMPS